MGIFGNLFGNREAESPELSAAIERAVSSVEPLLKKISGYPGSYREPVRVALEYARDLAARIPGPVIIDQESYARDSFVHALFPDADSVTEAICSSSALQGYLPFAGDFYALMGMRRVEKSIMGMQLSGEAIQRDVVQNMVYFTSHTLENPAASEQEARDLVAARLFDSLVDKVRKRIDAQKQTRQSMLLERDALLARVRSASAPDRGQLEAQLDSLASNLEFLVSALELSNYREHFQAVLLNPGQYLRLEQKSVVLDSMGIRREGDVSNPGEEFVFNELIGYDRRDWTVTMVKCRNVRVESFAAKLEKASRTLAV